VNPTTFVPNYAYYTALSLQTNQYFNANSAVAVAYTGGAVNGANRTVQQIQDHVLERVKGNDPFPYVLTAGEIAAATAGLRTRLADIYRDANPHLTAQLGAYCSYCEITIPGHQLDVEHKVPKQPYPRRIVMWQNFLQACGRCDSAKGQRPTRVTAIGWTGQANPSENAIMQAALNHYFWPDTDLDTYQRLRYRLRDALNGYALIPLPQAASLQNAYVSFIAYDVRANVQLAPMAALTANRRVEVDVRANTVTVMNTDTLGRLGLDQNRTARAGYRTLTWYKVLYYLTLMDQALNDPNVTGNAVMENLVFGWHWNMFLAAAQNFGHYSTIVTLLLQHPDPAFLPANLGTLGNRFIDNTDPANGPPAFHVWPGTDTTQVP
jgi:uncharacterized protein (TIGR02646 family)